MVRRQKSSASRMPAVVASILILFKRDSLGTCLTHHDLLSHRPDLHGKRKWLRTFQLPVRMRAAMSQDLDNKDALACFELAVPECRRHGKVRYRMTRCQRRNSMRNTWQHCSSAEAFIGWMMPRVEFDFSHAVLAVPALSRGVLVGAARWKLTCFGVWP